MGSGIPSSYDIVGSKGRAIIIAEFPEWVSEEEKKKAAMELLKRHKNARSVLEKSGERSGRFRLRKLKLLAGESRTEVLHKEHGYLLKLDPTKVYFSPREATERQRIASQIAPGERVLVMFSGVAPYCIAIGKKQPLVEEIVGIEINPHAHRYALENVRINKLEGKVRLYLGNVSDVCKRLAEKFDRIIMPLPRSAYRYLKYAFPLLKKGGVLHFYHVAREENGEKVCRKILERNARRFGREVKVLLVKKVLSYAPRKWKFVADAKVI